MADGFPYIMIEDKINTHLFFDEMDTPSLIFEGTSDYEFYTYILNISDHNWSEGIDFVIGKSKSNILKHHNGGLHFEYIAILDSDYDRYNKSLIEDDKIIYTHFYNMENYLTTSKVIKGMIKDMKTVMCQNITTTDILNQSISAIEPFIVCGLLKNDNEWSIKLEDLAIENNSYWDRQESRIKETEFKSYLLNSVNCERERAQIEELLESNYDEARIKVYEFIRDDKLDYILNGKQKFKSVFYRFKNIFPTFMDGVKENTFKVMIYRNLLECCYIKSLVEEIDLKASMMFRNKSIS